MNWQSDRDPILGEEFEPEEEKNDNINSTSGAHKSSGSGGFMLPPENLCTCCVPKSLPSRAFPAPPPLFGSETRV